MQDNIKGYDTNLFTEQEQTHRLREQTYGSPGEGLGSLDRYGQVYTAIFKTNKDLLCGPGNSAQCYVEAWMGWSLGKDGYMCYDG